MFLSAASNSEWFADVRLVNGSNSREGRVEIYYRGEWGTVCDDNWGQLEANVVCRQLGYIMSTTKAIAKQKAFYGRGSGKIWLDEMHCVGTEPLLGRCESPAFGSHDCNHGEDAGVICEGTC
ncbi:hypothetical protein LOTGIDRAFT_104858 [Lottia gigantea]|uniref:SRCR domain-containing protein n=1 Tax=Lottia gigantea TaxID=225164 RepID=V3ZRF3_LOTGI|nr:hypothetical protein LOTGIDRAFT_104858 [Lottia gigantea]ESO93998.1 hypothetical protein LOTGIDRAFT_104858 [Lottia gigantea]